jgi:hypothetical protein
MSEAGQVALAWVESAMDAGDLRRAWELTDPTLRLVLAQHWIMSQQGDAQVSAEDPDGLAAGLAASPSTHHLWDRFASARLRRWREHWGRFGTQTWGISDERQEVVPDIEIVTFMEKHRLLAWAKPGPPPVVRRFAMRSTPDGWLVAGLDGSALFQPGWPPTPAPLPRPGVPPPEGPRPDGRHRA